MSEFKKAVQDVEEIGKFLESLGGKEFSKELQAKLDEHNAHLEGALTEKMLKFKQKAEETDESKRVYGENMVKKVKALLEDYDSLLKKMRVANTGLEVNRGALKEQEEKLQEEARVILMEQQLAAESAAESQRSAEEEAQRQFEAAAAKMQALEDQRKQEHEQRKRRRELSSLCSKEAEARVELETSENTIRVGLSSEEATRRATQVSKEQKRKRTEELLSNHKKVMGKTQPGRASEKPELTAVASISAAELQSPAEVDAIGASKAELQGESFASETSTESEAPEKNMDVDEPGAELPPAPDAETEEVLIQRAIELSLQLSSVNQVTTTDPKDRDSQAPH